MSVRSIVLFPNPILNQPTEIIKDFNSDLKTLIEDLFDTMYHSPGIGLAAPQIGVPKQVSVIDVSRTFKKRNRSDASPHPLILINPIILAKEGHQYPREGCLSVPDWLAHVQRFEFISVQSRTPEGGDVAIEGKGLEALALQHEIDHLHGKLFIDRVVDLKTDLFRRKTYRKDIS